jgi:Fe-S-cluster containining protein
MKCRPGCAACCIAISISSPIPGMPEGKPAGFRCINLDNDNLCIIHGTELYPVVCRNFRASLEMCGKTAEEALTYLAELERLTGGVQAFDKNSIQEIQ